MPKARAIGICFMILCFLSMTDVFGQKAEASSNMFSASEANNVISAASGGNQSLEAAIRSVMTNGITINGTTWADTQVGGYGANKTSRSIPDVGSGNTCWAYANGFVYHMFGFGVSSYGSPTNSNGQRITGLTGVTRDTVSYNTFVNAGVPNRAGTLIRSCTSAYMNTGDGEGHSIVLLCYDTSGVYYIDGNGAGDYRVAVRYKTWAELKTSNVFVQYVWNGSAWVNNGPRQIKYAVAATDECIRARYPSAPCTTLQFTNVAYPPQFQINTTYGWHLAGGTVASNAELRSIRSVLSKDDGSWAQDTGEIGISGKYYSVSTINTSVKFSQITTPGAYTWTLTAKDANGRSLDLPMHFNVVSSGGTSNPPSYASATYDDTPKGSEMTSGYERTIPDGNYLIGNAANPRYYLDIEGAAFPAEASTNVQVAGALTGDPPSFDVWTVKYSGDGFYTIKQMNSDMSLDVTGASIAQCANLQVYPSNTSSAQKWAISQNGRNGYRIQAKCSGFSVDANGSATNGANIQQYSNHDGDNQSWVFIPYNPAQPVDNGRYILLSGMDTDFELDLPGDTGDLENGANVALWDIGAPSQYNSFDVAKLDNGYYYITHAASGKRLDVVSADRSYGTNIGIQSESDMWSQQWAITKNGSGYTLRTRTSGYALDISGSKAENGANAHQWPYHGLANQTWYFVPAEYTVSYDANGGTGAPASQTKYWHTPALTLSSTIPAKEGFTFLYWMAGSDDSAAIYNPGDSYTGDADLHLYAVWEQNGPRIKLSTNEISLTQFSDMVEIVATVQADESYDADLIWECIHAGDSTWDESMYFYGDNESAVIGPKERTGNYIVTCSTSDGEATASCIITVLPAPVIDIELSNTSLSLNAGDSYHLIEKITPSYTTLKDVIWKSNDPAVVSVADGDVFAVGEGTTTITCTAASDSTIKAICNVTVVVPVTSVTLNKSVYEFGNVSEGRLTLTATLLPENASNKTVTWSSSNESVAKVANGIVTPLEAGYTRITCASPDGPKGVCDIIVHADSIMQLPSALKNIEADAFSNSAIVEVIVPEGTTSIGTKAFANCKKLALISIPESTTNIAADAFSGSGKIAIICDEPCYATEFAKEKGIPYVLGTMPREVLIFAESNTISVGESVKLQGCVLPDNAPQTLRWSILEGKGIASIESNGSECIVSSTSVGHVTITATAINNATGTVDISIIEHPTTFGIRFDANGGLTDVSYRDAAFDVAIGTLPTPVQDYYTFTGWYTKASGGEKITSNSVFNDYYMGDITLFAHWTENAWSDWVESSSLPSGEIYTESKTQYRYQDASYSDWSGWSGWDENRQSTSELKEEESATVWYWYRYVCPNCGAHMHVYNKCYTWAGGCGNTIGSTNYQVCWLTTPPGSGTQDWEGTGRIMLGSGTRDRWFYWKDSSQGYPNGKSTTGYRYRTRTKSWGSLSGWTDNAVSASTTRNVETRTVYRYKMK